MYDKVYSRWMYPLTTEKRMRERSLILVRSDYYVPKIDEALKQYASKIFMKARAFKIFQGKLEEVDDKSINYIWTKLLSLVEKIEAKTFAFDTKHPQPSVQAGEPINVEDETIHISNTEHPEEETYAEDFITVVENVMEGILEMLTTLGDEEMLLEYITRGNPNDEAKEYEVITGATQNIGEEEATEVAQSMVPDNLPIVVQAIEIATKKQNEEAPLEKGIDKTKDKGEENGKENGHSGEDTQGEAPIETTDVVENVHKTQAETMIDTSTTDTKSQAPTPQIVESTIGQNKEVEQSTEPPKTNHEHKGSNFYCTISNI